MEKLKIIIIAGLPNIGTHKIVEQIFSFFPDRQFISSKSVVCQLKFSDTSQKMLFDEIAHAEQQRQPIIMSPNLQGIPMLVQPFTKETLGFFFTSKKYMPIENDLRIETDWQRLAITSSSYFDYFKKVFEIEGSLLLKKELELRKFSEEIAGLIREAEQEVKVA